MDVLLINASGLVTDCISADDVARAKHFFPDFTCIERTGAQGAGWTYTGGVFYPPATVSNNAVPESVSPRQIRQAMTALNLRSSVEMMINASPSDTQDWWRYATSFERNHPVVLSMAAALGKSTQDIDALFILAGTL